jgi:hypothetical protein
MGAGNRTPSVRLPARRGPRHPARTGRATRSLTQYHRRLLGGRGKVVRGGPGGNLRYRDLQRGRHGRVPTLTRASCRPIALGGLLTTRALRTARTTKSVWSNSPEGSPRIGADSIVSPSYDTRTHPSSVFGVYFYPAGRYRVSVHENVLQEGPAASKRVSSTSPSRTGSCANKFSTNLAPPGGGSPLPCV